MSKKKIRNAVTQILIIGFTFIVSFYSVNYFFVNQNYFKLAEFHDSLAKIDNTIYSPTIFLGSTKRNNFVEKEIAFKQPIRFDYKKVGTSSLITTPVEYNNFLFFGNGFWIRSLNKNTYKLNWEILTKAKVASPPFLLDNYLFASNEVGEFFCIDYKFGNIFWLIKLPKGTYGSPLVVDNKVIIGCWDHNVYCLEKNTGKIIWKQKTGAPINSTPAYFKDKIYICSDKLYCININNGKVIWSIISKRRNIIATPTIIGNFVLIGMSPKRTVLANVDTGRIYWEASIGDHVTSLVASEKIIVGSNSLGELFALNYYGELIWKIKLSAKTSSSPIVINNLIIVGDDNGIIYVVDLQTGMLITKRFLDCGEIETAGLLSSGIFFATTSGQFILIPVD